MTSWLGWRLPAAFVPITLSFAPSAMAQPRFQVRAAAALTESYDDNVFSVPDERRQDVISRLGAWLALAYRAPRFDVRLHGGREAEAFRDHPELNAASARQEAGIGMGWFPGGGFEAGATASYVETHSPAELAVISDIGITGFELVRGRANRFATTGSLSRRMGARTAAVVTHAFTRDEIVGGVESTTQAAAASLRRQVGPVDELTFSYGLRHFAALGHQRTSHALTVAWARDVTRQTHVELKAGARVSGRNAGPELGLTLRHRFRRGVATFSYVQTEALLIGRPTPAIADGLNASFTHALSRALTLTAGPRVFRARSDASNSTAYGTSLDLTWRFGRRFSLVGSHDLSIQHDDVDGRQRGEIVHNTVRLRLVAGSID